MKVFDYICDGQMSFDDFLKTEQTYVPGQWLEETEIGKQLTFDEIAQSVGNLIIMDYSTSSRNWYKVVRVERIIAHEGQRRLIYFDGTRQRGYVNEMYFREDYEGYRSKAYEIKNKN